MMIDSHVLIIYAWCISPDRGKMMSYCFGMSYYRNILAVSRYKPLLEKSYDHCRSQRLSAGMSSLYGDSVIESVQSHLSVYNNPLEST